MKGLIISLVLLAGIGVGIAGTVLIPKYFGSYMPKAVRAKSGSVEGIVRAKSLDKNRLLVTILTPRGAVLITFNRKVAEIDLLVEPGDMITLGLRDYEPFVTDPPVRKVAKGGIDWKEKPAGEPSQGKEVPASATETGESPPAGGESAPTPKGDKPAPAASGKEGDIKEAGEAGGL